MDPTDRNVDSGGGAVFQGNITAGRDITINQITEIRQATERLSIRCSGADASDKFLGSLAALSAAAEFTEDYAKELNSSVFASDPLLEKVSRECASILTELKQLEKSLGQDENGQNAITASFNEIVTDIRSRLTSLQIHISNVNSRKTAKDFEAIKEVVTQLMDDHQNSDDASSIRSFFTASSIPYVERQIWHEIEKSLRAQFTAEYVRDHYALIVASVEELVFENASPWIPEGARLKDSPSEPLCTTNTDTRLRLSEAYNIFTESDEDAYDEASLRPAWGFDPLVSDKSGVEWSRSIEDGTGESLLTFDGGGAKSYSSILIIQALMEEVVACENRLEQEFTHYPRTFDTSDFRPCHYFHKMYGTSTGGSVLPLENATSTSSNSSVAVDSCTRMLTDLTRILAIGLSRLRMTVRETIDIFAKLLQEMYGHIRGRLPLQTKYYHLPLKHGLTQVAIQYCKQHEQGQCSDEHKFRWRAPGCESEVYEDDEDDLSNPSVRSDRASRKSKVHALELQTPEYHLCQTICLAAVHTGPFDEVYLLRTYTHRYDPDICPPWATTYNKDTLDLYTWQVGRATTATPLLFETEVVTGPQGNLTMKDGGIQENNPSYCAWSEAASLWGDDNNPSLLLSIGAGYTKSTSDDFSHSGMMPFGLSSLNKYADRLAVFKNILVKYSAAQDRHKMMRTIARGGNTWYKRFEVTDGLEKMRADQWERGMALSEGKNWAVPGGKTLNIIRTATEAYLNRQEPDKSVNEYAAPREMLKQTAEKLVRMRRARELEAMTQGGEKREHWEAFMGKHLIGERDFFRKYQEEWDYALLGRKR